MLSIREYLEEELLTETAKLGRFWDHMKNDENAFVIITAFRPEDEKSKKQSEADNKTMGKEIRKAGYGYKWVDGAWIDNKDTAEEQHLKETSLFIVGDTTSKLWSLAKKWAKRYNQDSFVYKPPGAGEEVRMYSKKGKMQAKFTKLHMDKISMYYTKIRGGDHHGRPWFYDTEFVSKPHAPAKKHPKFEKE